MRQLVYISKAQQPYSKTEVDEIAKVSNANNNLSNVTGCMIYASGFFIQLLEGDSDKVEKLYIKIKQDNRHHSCVVLFDQETDEDKRLYGKWFMSSCYITEDARKFPPELKSRINSIISNTDTSGMVVHRIFSEFKKYLVH